MWYAIYADGEPQPRSLTTILNPKQIAASGLKVELIGESLPEYGYDWVPDDPVQKLHARPKPKAVLHPGWLVKALSGAEYVAIVDSPIPDVRRTVEMWRMASVLDMNRADEHNAARLWEACGLIAHGRADELLNFDPAAK